MASAMEGFRHLHRVNVLDVDRYFELLAVNDHEEIVLPLLGKRYLKKVY